MLFSTNPEGYTGLCIGHDCIISGLFCSAVDTGAFDLLS